MGENNKNPLGEIKFNSNLYELDIDGQFNLHLEKKGHELISTFRTDIEDPHISRFILGHGQHIYLEPGFPDLPIVIKPTRKLSILPDCTLETYIDVPMVLKLTCGTQKKRDVLHEFPIKPLSRSWFGDPVNGEIAYFLESSLEHTIEACESDLSCVHCPVTIINRTNQILDLERMILRVPYLNIYKGKIKYYSNRTKIAFRGQDQISQITIQKTAPEIEPKLEMISLPRLDIDSGLLKKSFYFIKTLYEG